MLDHYKLITVTHKDLNVEELEHFIVKHKTEDELVEKLESIKNLVGQDEILYLATCNRVIYFFHGKHRFERSDVSKVIQQLNPRIGNDHSYNLDRIVQSLTGLEAIKHLYEVASSLDSLVVGEREIFHQFRKAYNFCRSKELCSDNIRLVENSVVKAAKEVYTNTAIGSRPVSVVSLAIQEFLKRQLPTDSKVLLIGAGETNTTAGRFLGKHGYNNLVIFNRSLDNAKELSEELGTQAEHLNALKDYQGGFDCIIACTASQDIILTQEAYDHILQDGKKKLIIDLAIPRNVSAEVAVRNNVDYINVENIRPIAEENLQFRKGNIGAAKIILNLHLDEFAKKYERRKVERAFGELPVEVQKVKDRALHLIYKEKIDQLSPEAQILISEIADYMEKKCVAIPMKLAKQGINLD